MCVCVHTCMSVDQCVLYHVVTNVISYIVVIMNCVHVHLSLHLHV